MLIVIAIVAVLISFAVPVPSSQLERAGRRWIWLTCAPPMRRSPRRPCLEKPMSPSRSS
ncbi:hypothetical protein [Dysosmobacter sp.]|uniref:hypothetical protein n=1 Tax=Dysosmobacter sp. TaxID=2591382 RepID=UPI003AB5D714